MVRNNQQMYATYRIDWEEKVDPAHWHKAKTGHVVYHCYRNEIIKTFRAEYPYEKYRITALYQVLAYNRDVNEDIYSSLTRSNDNEEFPV